MAQPIDLDDEAQVQRLLDYENAAYLAADAGRYQTAIDRWQHIIDSDDYREFFALVPESLAEIYWNLAIAYWLTDQPGLATSTVTAGGWSEHDFLKAVSGVRAS